MSVPQEAQILEEMAKLAGMINKRKRERIQTQKRNAEEKKILQELALVSGLVNKRKREGDATVTCKCTYFRFNATVTKKRSQPSSKRRRTEKKTEQCLFYAKFGECKKGAHCPFKHDPKKVAVCTKFLRGECTNPQCRLQHSPHLKDNNVCYHFLQGICTNANCPYTHVKVNAQAAICPDFLKGYCPRGLTCKLKHVKKVRNQVLDKPRTPKADTTTEDPQQPNDVFLSDCNIRPTFDESEDEEVEVEEVVGSEVINSLS